MRSSPGRGGSHEGAGSVGRPSEAGWDPCCQAHDVVEGPGTLRSMAGPRPPGGPPSCCWSPGRLQRASACSGRGHHRVPRPLSREPVCDVCYTPQAPYPNPLPPDFSRIPPLRGDPGPTLCCLAGSRTGHRSLPWLLASRELPGIEGGRPGPHLLWLQTLSCRRRGGVPSWGRVRESPRPAAGLVLAPWGLSSADSGVHLYKIGARDGSLPELPGRPGVPGTGLWALPARTQALRD